MFKSALIIFNKYSNIFINFRITGTWRGETGPELCGRISIIDRVLTTTGYTNTSFARRDIWLPRGGIDFSLVTPFSRPNRGWEGGGGYPADGSPTVRHYG